MVGLYCRQNPPPRQRLRGQRSHVMSGDVLHYPGDCTDFDLDQILGPDQFGGCWKPIRAEYDPELDPTTMTSKRTPPAELQERIDRLAAAGAARTRLRRLFGTTP